MNTSTSTSTSTSEGKSSRPSRSQVHAEIAEYLRIVTKQQEQQQQQLQQQEQQQKQKRARSSDETAGQRPVEQEGAGEKEKEKEKEIDQAEESKSAAPSPGSSTSTTTSSLSSRWAGWEEARVPRSVEELLYRMRTYSIVEDYCVHGGLLLLHRMLHATRTPLTQANVRPLFLVAVMLASKFLDDVTYNSATFASMADIPLPLLNALEARFLNALAFNCSLPPSHLLALPDHIAAFLRSHPHPHPHSHNRSRSESHAALRATAQ